MTRLARFCARWLPMMVHEHLYRLTGWVVVETRHDPAPPSFVWERWASYVQRATAAGGPLADLSAGYEEFIP